MAAVFVLAMGVGGWLMYEAYKGSTISQLKTKLLGTTQAAANVPETNALDTGN